MEKLINVGKRLLGYLNLSKKNISIHSIFHVIQLFYFVVIKKGNTVDT